MSVDYPDFVALDEASQAVDDILDAVLSDPSIPKDAVKEFLEDIEYRFGVTARDL